MSCNSNGGWLVQVLVLVLFKPICISCDVMFVTVLVGGVGVVVVGGCN